jgi:glycosyltransferase involved in cell wall biosynthesis
LPVLREVLDQSNSILLPPENIDSWVEAIRAISKDPSRQYLLGKQARETSKKFSWESRAQTIFALSDKLLPR